MTTLDSHGSRLKETTSDVLVRRLERHVPTVCRDGGWVHSRPGQDRQVGEARDAHQRLVDQDGVHGLFNTVLRLQRRQEQFHLLPVGGSRGQRPLVSSVTPATLLVSLLEYFLFPVTVGRGGYAGTQTALCPWARHSTAF